MTTKRLQEVVARLSDARARAAAARARGDDDGYRYAIAEVKRARRILEGAGL